ncbi:unnamed protein product [Sphenostylis stenocarpa]|uniref:SHSP domain-containing protein n=1 Tax=Sphenostylis stenocarpa TaxID=92480 RepID=A0AA86S815_9FABA|nr:unnamed protein product [Sphenostylis stenocarpa]
MMDLEGAEGYRPSAEYVEDSNEALINLTDSTELLFLKLPSSNELDDGRAVFVPLSYLMCPALRVHQWLNFHVMLTGKVYDFVSYSAQEPDETVFISSTEPKIGKISMRVSTVHYPDPKEFEKLNSTNARHANRNSSGVTGTTSSRYFPMQSGGIAASSKALAFPLCPQTILQKENQREENIRNLGIPIYLGLFLVYYLKEISGTYNIFLSLSVNTAPLPLRRQSSNKQRISCLRSRYNLPTFKSLPKMSLIPSFFGGRRSNVLDPFSLDVWDPFKDFPFPNSLSASFPEFSQENSAFVSTRVDWKETPEAHVFQADLPGLTKEEVKVEIEDNKVVQISGERNVEKEDKKDKWHRVERSSGKFMRRFRLPENAKVEEVKASMKNGVLTVTVPKQEVKKADVKTIEISG